MADFNVQLQCGPCLATPEVQQRFVDLHSMGATSTEEKENSDREDEEEEEETADEPWSR
jgi:hypothetical protein